MTEPRVPAIESAISSPVSAARGSGLEFRLRKLHHSPGQDFVLDAAFQAAPGFTILFGPSGSGKTTLLDCVAGLTRPDAGRIAVADRVLFDSSQDIDVPVRKRRVGYVFQNLALFPHLTVRQNVEYGLHASTTAIRAERSRAILSAFHISELVKRRPSEISGGERQRTALARTLVTDPEVLLLDEPLTALDASTKSGIIEDLRNWNRSHRVPILYVTHSREEVFALGERVLVLEDGRMTAQGTPHEVMEAPTRETVAQLAGFENVYEIEVDALSPQRGTMTCRLKADPPTSAGATVLLETPLVRAQVGMHLIVGIRAGDILLATSQPTGLSARNVLPGPITSLHQRDTIVIARVNCGVEMEVHLTLAARDSLQLTPGRQVWLVIKTHSCHLMQK